MTAMRGLRAVLGVAAALLLVVTAAAGQAAMATLRLGVVASVSDAGFFIAVEQGYFAEQGLAIEFVPFRSAADMIAPLGVGQLDIGGGAGSAGLFNPLARGLDPRPGAHKGTIRAGKSYGALFIRPDPVESGRLKTAADCKG